VSSGDGDFRRWNNLLPPYTLIGGPSRLEHVSGGRNKHPPVWGCAPGLGSPRNAMTGEVVAAPAPGSLNTANLSGGAVDGGCPSSDKAQAPWGKEVRYYADIHKTKKNRERYRITYTTDGTTYKHVDSFAEIPAKAGDMVFVDTIPLSHTDGVIELLRRGVEVYYMRRLTIQKRKRDELKLPKTTRGDIKALMVIDRRWFRRVSEDFLVMRRMITTYRTLMKTHQQYLNRYKAVSEKERDRLKPVIESLVEQMDKIMVEIAEEAGKRYPAYNKIVDMLGIRGNAKAMEALAEVLLPEWRSWRGIRNYFGLWDRDGKTHYHRSKTARQALERLTITIKGYGVKGGDLEEVLKTIWIALKAQRTGPPA